MQQLSQDEIDRLQQDRIRLDFLEQAFRFHKDQAAEGGACGVLVHRGEVLHSDQHAKSKDFPSVRAALDEAIRNHVAEYNAPYMAKDALSDAVARNREALDATRADVQTLSNALTHYRKALKAAEKAEADDAKSVTS
jgi:hypothetical protein